MKRLTERDEYGNAEIIALPYVMPLHAGLSASEVNALTDALNRLAAYEDTGLEPEEIKELLNDSTGPLHNKLGKWIKAEAEGRLLILPCKVGDAVYFLWHHFGGSAEIVQGKVSMLQQKSDLSWKFRVSEGGSVFDRKMDDIGKTVFLAREEAEVALSTGDSVQGQGG